MYEYIFSINIQNFNKYSINFKKIFKTNWQKIKENFWEIWQTFEKKFKIFSKDNRQVRVILEKI